MSMPGCSAVVLLAGLSVACGAAPASDPGRASTKSSSHGEGGARRCPGPAHWFQSSLEQAFWVTHGEEQDRIVANGNRVEVDRLGRVRVAAPSEGALLGSLAVADHLGDGYVHWSRGQVFRSKEFTGPLEPVALPQRAERELRGARNGLSDILVFTDAEVWALSPDGHAVSPAPRPAMADFAALDARRGLLLDVFGRSQATSDGGSTWRDLTADVGLSPGGIGLTEHTIWIDSRRGQLELLGDPLGDPRPVASVQERYQPGEIRYSNTRRTRDVHSRWGRSTETLLMSAVRAGVMLSDGKALGLSSQRLGIVDLETGQTVEEYGDPLHSGLSCRPFRAADGVLFACRWEQYQYYGAYVLWSEHGLRPTVEHAFSDDGVFIGTDDGALAYTGACQATPRFVDGSRFHSGDESLSNTVCVRRGPGQWAERQLPDAVIARWVPSVDGTAVAMVRGRDASLEGLAERVDAPPSMSVRGVRVLAVPNLEDDHELLSVGAGEEHVIERSFSVDRDGTVAGWAIRSRDDGDVHVGVEITPSGRVAIFEPPPNTENTVTTGRWGLARSREGQLFETQDRGRTWASVERSPLGAGGFNGSCSALGCVLSSFVRVGWGTAALDVRGMPKQDPPSTEESGNGRVKLRCQPRGNPSVVAAIRGEHAAVAASRRGTSMATSYGDTLRLVQLATDETDASESEDAPDAKKAEQAAVATHAVVWTPPFAIEQPPRALAVVLPEEGRVRNPLTIPLLDESGNVALLVVQEKDELLVRDDAAQVWPVYEDGRGFWGPRASAGGLLTSRGADVVIVANQLPSLERHGPGPSTVARFFGLERSEMLPRHVSLAVAGGTQALLSFNRSHPDPVGVAEIRSHGDLAPAESLAAWRDALPLGDSRCPAKGAGYRGVFVIDPAAWFSLDESVMPGVRLGHLGLLLAHWGTDRVCVEAMRLSVSVDRDGTDVAAIVGRFGGRSGRAALRSEDIVQPLQCEITQEPR